MKEPEGIVIEHYHVAKYVDDKLTDECAECGKDLRDPVHKRWAALDVAREETAG